jgi:hypothetical protein
MKSLSLAILMLASPAPALAAQCAGTLDTFLAAGFSCSVADKLFSNFSYNNKADNATLAGPDASKVQVIAVLGGTDPGPGLTFNFTTPGSALSVVGAGLKDVTIGFTVGAPAGVTISGARLEASGLGTTVRGGEIATVNATLTPGGNLPQISNGGTPPAPFPPAWTLRLSICSRPWMRSHCRTGQHPPPMLSLSSTRLPCNSRRYRFL